MQSVTTVIHKYQVSLKVYSCIFLKPSPTHLSQSSSSSSLKPLSTFMAHRHYPYYPLLLVVNRIAPRLRRASAGRLTQLHARGEFYPHQSVDCRYAHHTHESHLSIWTSYCTAVST